MTNLPLTMTVNTEQPIHEMIRQVLQFAQDQQGIIVNRISIDWADVSVVGCIPRSVITRVALDTECRTSDIPRPR